MYISKTIIKGFRAFNTEGATMVLKNRINAFIGLNSSGKTAALEALTKIFGVTKNERDILKQDFHVAHEEDIDSIEEKSLSIEVQMNFGDSDKESIPHFFNQMVVDDEGEKPYIRIRLESTWYKSEFTDEGEIETSIFFVTVPEGEIEDEDSKRVFPKHLRGLIQVLYIPAIRKPSDQIRYVSGSILYRVLHLLNFDDKFKEDFSDKAEEINDLFKELNEFNEIQSSLTTYWKKFHKDERYKQTSLGFGNSDLDSILKKLEVSFSPTETNRAFQINDLGEGYRSLFYLTLVCALLEVEEKIIKEDDDKIRPVLTILAVEEPENHIAPQLLGRVISILTSISTKEKTQVFLSSHTPAIIKRIDPESIFHFRVDNQYKAEINSILLPKKKDEAYKYVKEAIRNYPEIYFAKLAVIGEGDSEEVLFNRLMETNKVDFDDNIITFVPLGHRFVNHIWKLLDVLNIPYVTLLDLDIERNGGGWGRIKYILQQLIDAGYDRDELLELEGGEIMTDERFSKMHTWTYKDNKLKSVLSWVKFLESYNVYYSNPLDLDFLMLEYYSEKYKSAIPKGGGPQIPDKVKEDAKFKSKLKGAIQATLKSEEAQALTYSDKQKELMIWYNYHFLGRGKPTTHITALSSMTDKELSENMPPVFEKMFKKIKELLS
ncbi:ATP-dependent nuclease [Saccharicrinis fermentans]|uniref:ATP-dependent nuclease n=1 Tax=Saccharicrinis fermentans TaxID=982 RepID=UPI0004890FA3|nr:AAA family ATPase [Saccharicrinis fermentans]